MKRSPDMNLDELRQAAPVGSVWYVFGRHVEVTGHKLLHGLPHVQERDLNTGKKIPTSTLGYNWLRKVQPSPLAKRDMYTEGMDTPTTEPTAVEVLLSEVSTAAGSAEPTRKEVRNMTKATKQRRKAKAAERSTETPKGNELFSTLMGEVQDLSSKDKDAYSRLFKGDTCVAWVHRRKNSLRVDARLQAADLPKAQQGKVKPGLRSFGVRIPVATAENARMAASVINRAAAALDSK